MEWTKREKFKRAQIGALQRSIGMVGTIIIDWNDLDFEVGRGIGPGNDRCMWNKDGRRIDVCVSSVDGSILVAQTKEPDPDKPTEKL